MSGRRPARVVHETDVHAFRLDDQPSWQGRTHSRLVHVAVHRGHGSERSELVQHRRGGEIARVQDEIRPLEDADAVRGEAALATRKMRVSK